MMVSGVLTLVILSALCLIYYNPPMSAAQPDGYTNWKYVPNSSWRFMTEGHGHGTINSLGYNDPQDPIPGVESICFSSGTASFWQPAISSTAGGTGVLPC